MLRNVAEADEAISRMGEGWQKEAIQLMITGVQRFYSEQPSLLAGDLDIPFLVEILKDTIALVQHDLTHEWVGWPDWNYSQTWAVENPKEDQSRWGLRSKQAGNFAAGFAYDRRLQGALLSVFSHISRKQFRNGGTNWDGTAYAQVLPCARPDCLFIVRAVYHALRPGQPARQLLEGLGDLTKR
jgi:hypothetical protein